jgi:hypothetical protein
LENFFLLFDLLYPPTQKISRNIFLSALTPLFRTPKRGYIRGDTGGGRGIPLWWGVDVGGFANQIISRTVSPKKKYKKKLVI